MNVHFSKGRLDFIWDDVKAASNFAKHGITFERATKLFDDLLAEFIESDVNEEGRTAVIGVTRSQQMLYVIHIEYDDGPIRLISAREASRRERQIYEKHA